MIPLMTCYFSSFLKMGKFQKSLFPKGASQVFIVGLLVGACVVG